MKSRRTVAVLLAATASASTPAYAQAPQSPDPEDGTPAAMQYQLPVDNARRDAAPRTVSRGSDPGGLGSGSSDVPAGSPAGATTSTIRSDNGFNTSARVPGAQEARERRNGKGDGKGEGDARGSVSPSGGGNGSGGTPPAVETTFTPLASTEPGSVRSALLLLLAALVGGGVGLAARRARRA